MITDIIRDGFNLDLLIKFLARIFVIFCVLPIHEYAHALVATKLGDQTARLSGRLTLNPLAHIDPIGALMILLAGFGYAKPVPVNIRNFKDRKVGMALTAIAGPISNLIMGFLSLVLLRLLMFVMPESTVKEVIYLFLIFSAGININLAVFNLLPIPPLDGSRLATLFLPDRIYYKIMQYERYIILVVLVLMLTGVLTTPLVIISNFIFDLMLLILGIKP
ncbi:MAG: site-2 protease family protein [Acutalibacteraceae bacterium]|jgi:Zn-dependent protease